MALLVILIIALLCIIAPGLSLAFALLRNTKLNKFEIASIGFIFGLIFPPTMVWLESYLISFAPFFAFSLSLYLYNVIFLTLLGILLTVLQGGTSYEAVKPFLGMKSTSITPAPQHTDPEAIKLPAKSNMHFVWYILFGLMVLAFITRVLSIGTAPNFFEFDPYFDMQSTEYILVHGYQILYDHSAWPTITAGSPHRIEPIVPYLEAFWYELANSLQYHYNTAINTTLLSDVSSFYPPLAAALLVFVVFMFLYHEYGEFPAIIGAALATAMPALITTFIAGEQLVEPWGIMSLFFFYAAYLLAVNNMKEKRFAILAGLAFVSTFLGAHYYTVDAGVLAIYILIQGLIFVFRKHETKDFYILNTIIIAIIALFYVVFEPYGSVLSNRIPALLGVPIIIGFPLFAMVFVLVFEWIPKIAQRNKILFQDLNTRTYAAWFVALIVIAVLLMSFTSLGEPVQKYIQLSTHFTTASIPLFATVQEYAPTGYLYNFGAAGFGVIGASVAGVDILVWLVLLVFSALAILAVYYRNSKVGVLSLAAIWPLAIAGMIEVKYLPHFGVGYILAIGAIIGELMILIEQKFEFKNLKNIIPKLDLKNIQILAIVVVSIFAVLAESFVYVNIAIAASNPDCNSIAAAGNNVGYTLYCQTVPQSWLAATAWMRANVGPFAPRILSWWDYGDWINWFGNSNAVLRGDNAVATLDYATAAQYVLTQSTGYNTTTLSTFMNGIQAKYVLFDDQLMQKWGALDFLACVHANQTSLAFAQQQGQAQGKPYALGNSQCELSHDPIYALVSANKNTISSFCNLNGTNQTTLKTFLLAGSSLVNSTYCVPESIFSNTPPPFAYIYNSNGTLTNAIIVPRTEFFYGVVPISSQPFADFLVLYLPNGPNNTVTDAPSQFYNSSFYKGFFFGKLSGFTLVYPQNFTGMNYITSSNPVMIFQYDNYTGGNPYVTPKLGFIKNNYTVPG